MKICHFTSPQLLFNQRFVFNAEHPDAQSVQVEGAKKLVGGEVAQALKNGGDPLKILKTATETAQAEASKLFVIPPHPQSALEKQEAALRTAVAETAEKGGMLDALTVTTEGAKNLANKLPDPHAVTGESVRGEKTDS